MRLTLRTLLSYLDDTLEPAQARLIGQKVSESDVAKQLIARIKDVIRQRRLTVPPATGPTAKLDINTAAEYLDNELPADKLAEVEEICLESDVYLSEIAACHQILTLVLGEPARVPVPARQRMYALSKGRHALPRRRPVAAAAAGDSEGADEADRKLLLGFPLYEGTGPVLRRLAPLAGILVLVVALGVVIWKVAFTGDPDTKVVSGDPGKEKTTNPARDKGADPDKDQGADPDKDKGKGADPDKDKGDASKDKGDPSKDKGDPSKYKGDPSKDKGDTGKDKDDASKDKGIEKMSIDQVPVDKPSAERRFVGKYAVQPKHPSLMLQKPSNSERWKRLPPSAKLATTDPLVSLPGFRSDIQLESKVTLTLWGNLVEFSEVPVLESNVVLYAPGTEFDLDFLLDHGRVVVANHKPAGPARVKVRFQREVWELLLENNQTVVGMEVWGRYPRDVPFSKEPGGEAPETVMGLFLFAGQASLKAGYQTFGLPKDSMFIWDNVGPASRRPEPLPGPLKEWWVNRAAQPKTPQGREMLIAVEELSQRLNKKGADLDVVLAEVIKDAKAKPTNRVLSVLCLGAVDALSNLIDALQSDRPEVRGAAVLTLRHWCGVNVDRDLKLFKLFHDQKQFSWLHAEITMSLLHSFSDVDFRKPDTYETLIEYLRHDKVAIRELAFWHLSRMVPEGAKKFPFDPVARADQRELVYKQWKEYIPDGKLPPFRPAPLGPPKK